MGTANIWCHLKLQIAQSRGERRTRLQQHGQEKEIEVLYQVITKSYQHKYYESSSIYRRLYGWMATLVTQPYVHLTFPKRNISFNIQVNLLIFATVPK